MATLVFKPTTACNASCSYCAVVAHGNHATITDELLQVVYRRIEEFLSGHPSEDLSVIWHGGEVALLGPAFFRNVLQLHNELSPAVQERVYYKIQTNATALDQELIDTWKQLGITTVGSSYDPLPGIRCLGSPRSSRKYAERFFKGVALLEKNGITWNAIYVVHKKSLETPEALYFHLTNMNLRGRPQFNRIYIYDKDRQDLTVSGEEYAEFLGRIIRVAVKSTVRFPKLNPIDSFVNRAANPQASLPCVYTGNCAHSWLYIGPEGEVSHCGRSGDEQIMMAGNIEDVSIRGILYSEKREEFAVRSAYLLENDCKGCRFWTICHGGCPTDAFMRNGTLFSRGSTCEWVPLLAEQYLEPLYGIRFH
jgi:uncharacterized protein